MMSRWVSEKKVMNCEMGLSGATPGNICCSWIQPMVI